MADPGPRARRFAGLVAVELAAVAERRGLLKRDVAAALGVIPGQLSRYLSGQHGQLTTAQLVRACERLGVQPDVIVRRAYGVLLEERGGPADDPGPEPGTGPGPTPPAGSVQVPSRPAHARARSGDRGASGTTSARTGARKRPS